MYTYKLVRIKSSKDGTFSNLTGPDGTVLAVTAEHSYEGFDGVYLPKVLDGIYVCHLGDHILDSGPVRTFEIMDVPGHTGILFHVGNYPQTDSKGCVLVGENMVGNMITNSIITWKGLMSLWGTKDFQLVVSWGSHQ